MNHYFKLKDYEDIVGRYNPMGIRTDKGPLSFATLTEAYYYVIEKLFVTFPRGYLDLPLFVCKETNINIRDAERFVKIYGRTMGCDEIMLIKLWCKNRERDEFLRRLCNMLHMVTGTTFKNDFFLEALNRFDNQYEQLKSRIEKGDTP